MADPVVIVSDSRDNVPRQHKDDVGGKSGRGRPIAYTDKQVLWMDRLNLEIRERGGRNIPRTEMIQAIIQGVVGAKLDLADAQDAVELSKLIRECLELGQETRKAKAS